MEKMRFPQQLYLTLTCAETLGLGESISWLQGGQTFTINDRNKFMDEVAPHFFPKQTHFRSFERQLNWWGFRRLVSTQGRSTWYHPHFVRDKQELLGKIKHVPLSGRAERAPVRSEAKNHFILENCAISSSYANIETQPSIQAQNHYFDAHGAYIECDIDTMLHSIINDIEPIQNVTRPSIRVAVHNFDVHGDPESPIINDAEPIINSHDADKDQDTDSEIKSTRNYDEQIDSASLDDNVADTGSTSVGATCKATHLMCFPLGLHAILNEVETLGLGSAISWSSNGKSFAIHDKDAFMKQVASTHFPKQSKYQSFRRQLHNWGFTPITGQKGAWMHKNFVRDDSSLISQMTHRKKMNYVKKKERSLDTMCPLNTIPHGLLMLSRMAESYSSE